MFTILSFSSCLSFFSLFCPFLGGYVLSLCAQMGFFLLSFQFFIFLNLFLFWVSFVFFNESLLLFRSLFFLCFFHCLQLLHKNGHLFFVFLSPKKNLTFLSVSFCSFHSFFSFSFSSGGCFFFSQQKFPFYMFL